MVDHLLRGHGAFRQSYIGDEHEFLHRLTSPTQRPGALYVGCSDSRVVPELLTTSSPGQLFVVRNVANLVPPLEHADASVGAALEYAVEHLHVPHVIVCGHYGCGGVRAVIEGRAQVRSLPSLYEWLEGVEPAVARARAALGEPAADADITALWHRAVEENVLDQVANLMSFAPLREAHEAGRLEMHGWIYDLFTLRLHVYDRDRDAFVPSEEMVEAVPQAT